MEKVLFICGVYEIAISLLNHTKGVASRILLKVIPFFIGIATLLCAMDLIGWVNIF